MNSDSSYSSYKAFEDSTGNDPFHRMLDEFRKEMLNLPDYSPRYKEWMNLLRPTLGIAKSFN